MSFRCSAGFQIENAGQNKCEPQAENDMNVHVNFMLIICSFQVNVRDYPEEDTCSYEWHLLTHSVGVDRAGIFS